MSNTDNKASTANTTDASSALVLTYEDRNDSSIVRKSNELVQMAMYDMTLTQQKLMLHIFSMIRPTDTELPEYELSIYQFCKLCDIDPHSGRIYKYVANAIEEIANMKVRWVSVPGTQATRTFRWIDRAEINRETGRLHIWLDSALKPHLIQLKEFYTSFNIVYTLQMRSRYSIRVYELCKSYQNLYEQKKQQKKPLIWTLDTLKQQLSYPYEGWADVRRFILEQAKKEINGNTDILFDYEPSKRKYRKIVEISVSIEKAVDSVAQEALELTASKKKSGYKTKAQRQFEEALATEKMDDKNVVSLGYVSMPGTTIPYSFGPDHEKMVAEIKLRAEYDALCSVMTPPEISALMMMIDAMASMAGAHKSGEKVIDGGNAAFFGAMNEVILRCGSLKPWFEGTVKEYAASKIPASQEKKNPLAYLFKILQTDLENFRFYTEKKDKNAATGKNAIDVEYTEVAEKEEAEFVKNEIIGFESAETERTMREAICSRMDLDKLSAQMQEGQRQALEEIITIVTKLCRRKKKGVDDGVVKGKANLTYIGALNKVISAYGSLDMWFEAAAHLFDYDVYWSNLAKNKKIRNPRQVFDADVDKALVTGIATIRAYDAQKADTKPLKPKEDAFHRDWNAEFDD